MNVSTRNTKMVTITMDEGEAQELYHALFPLADNKVKCENYIYNGVQKMYRALLEAGFKWVGD